MAIQPPLPIYATSKVKLRHHWRGETCGAIGDLTICLLWLNFPVTKPSFAAGQVLRPLQNTEYPVFKPKLHVVFIPLPPYLSRKVAILWKKLLCCFMLHFHSWTFINFYFCKDQRNSHEKLVTNISKWTVVAQETKSCEKSNPFACVLCGSAAPPASAIGHACSDGHDLHFTLTVVSYVHRK